MIEWLIYHDVDLPKDTAILNLAIERLPLIAKARGR